MTRYVLCFVVFFGLIGAAQAEIICSHSGSTDPLNEGFSYFRTDSASGGAYDDGGVQTWRMNDTWTSGNPLGMFYGYLCDSEAVSDAAGKGWSLDFSVKVASNLSDAACNIRFYTNDTMWLLQPSITGEDQSFKLQGASSIGESLTKHVLTGSGSNYIDFHIIYDPDAATAKVYANGALAASDWVGWESPGNSGKLQFYTGTNTTSDFRMSSLQFSVVPEPGTLALLACGLTGLLAYAWRKRK